MDTAAVSELIRMAFVEPCEGTRTRGVECRLMIYKHGPRWSNTWWGRRTAIVNISIAVLLLLFVLWKALSP